MVRDRARAIALHELKRVRHTMKLEAQSTDVDLEESVEEYIRSNINLRDLWTFK